MSRIINNNNKIYKEVVQKIE